jgi:nitroreductase
MDASGDAEALERLLLGRWSCRGFDPQPVPRPVIERLLTLAQRTPSWCNTQPWRLVLTSGDATARLSEQLSARQRSASAAAPDIPFPTAYLGEYLDRRRECGFQLYAAVGVERGDRAAGAAQAEENFRFFGAPHFVLITAPRDLGPYGAVDCGGYVSVFLLAARALGLAAIPQRLVADLFRPGGGPKRGLRHLLRLRGG